MLAHLASDKLSKKVYRVFDCFFHHYIYFACGKSEEVFKLTCCAIIKDTIKKKIDSIRMQLVIESLNAFANRRKAAITHGSAHCTCTLYSVYQVRVETHAVK